MTLLSFVTMGGLDFAGSVDARLLRDLKSVRKFVCYRNDDLNDFLTVEYGVGSNTFEVNTDAYTGERFKRPQDFFQKYGLPPSDGEVEASVIAARRAKPSARQP